MKLFWSLFALVLFTLAPQSARAKDNIDFAPHHDSPILDVVVEVDHDEARIVEPSVSFAEGYSTLYLNKCDGGETITRGFNDSRSNTSSIIDRTRTFAAYPHGEDSWQEVVGHVRDMLAPYGIRITDQDPGNEPHTEIIVCGDSFRGDNVLGVAPFGCGVVQNAIGYAFAENHSNDPRSIAETVVHEAGHTYSLNHLYDCEDPMTYLGGCGNKYFQDTALECAGLSGSNMWETQDCSCGGSSQNSHQTLLSAFGLRDVDDPTVEITFPRHNQTVEAGFPVRARGNSEVDLVKARLFIDGEFLGEVDGEPWVFNAPRDLEIGVYQVTVEMEDQLGNVGSESLSVVRDEPCNCADGEVCIDDSCFAGPDAIGGIGTSCDSDEECDSGLCARSGDEGYCTAVCDLGDETEDSCPLGFACTDAGGTGVCWSAPSDETTGCGCSSSRGGGSTALLLFALALLGVRTRRRQRA